MSLARLSGKPGVLEIHSHNPFQVHGVSSTSRTNLSPSIVVLVVMT